MLDPVPLVEENVRPRPTTMTSVIAASAAVICRAHGGKRSGRGAVRLVSARGVKRDALRNVTRMTPARPRVRRLVRPG